MKPFDDLPCIIGTISTLDALLDVPTLEAIPCDVVEVRLDQVGVDGDWLAACKAIEDCGIPVLLTLRLAAEGGAWTGGDSARQSILTSALDVVSAIDLELQSVIVPDMAQRLAERGKSIVISFHDFETTPADSDIEATLGRMSAWPNAIAKAALMAHTQADVDRIAALLTIQRPVPTCLIAMGGDWADTRVTFPQNGSALTYAYLDTPSAPGQLSCSEVRKRLRA